ncbi:MAG: putative phage tail protein [Pseudomonadota bacterium]
MTFALELRADVSGDAWRATLIDSLPHGWAWAAFRTPGSTAYEALLPPAQVFARVERRIADMLRELDWTRTVELLALWEETAGLPDECAPDFAQTLESRRDAVVGKMRGRGITTPAVLIAYAASYGFTVTVDEVQVWRFGESTLSERLNGIPNQVTIRVDGIPVYYWQHGSADWTLSDPLAKFDADVINCLIRREAPAQLLYVFDVS